MNTKPKVIVYIECLVCGDVYGRSGESEFRLAQRRPATSERPGYCPRHKPKGQNK